MGNHRWVKGLGGVVGVLEDDRLVDSSGRKDSV